MTYKKTTWKEKLLDSKDLPKIVNITKKQSQIWGKGTTMVIAPPLEVDEIMRSVPEGKIITVNRIREKLAQKHNADLGCPITAGIFSWISAHAAMDDEKAGAKKTTPWWRTIKSNGELNAKFPGGIEEQAKRLKKEGISIIPGRKKDSAVVKDFEEHCL